MDCNPCQSFNFNHQHNDSNHNKYESKPLTLFRRVLPCPPAITCFDSDCGILLFQNALLNGTMKNFFALSSHFLTQDEPAFCGLSTLVMALNTLNVDSGRLWRQVGYFLFYCTYYLIPLLL